MILLNRLHYLVVICSGLALAACATTRPAQVAASPVPVAAETAPAEGGYKVGNPYQVDGKWYYPAEDYNYKQEGIASWYGADFHGKRTANGERYDMNGVSAAHPTLPLPSVVKVTNLDNGRVLNVRINDRGPYHSSRIIDLSRRAAQLLGFYDVGTARVRVEIDAQESMALKNLALKEHPPEMPKMAAVPRSAVSSAQLAPVVATGAEIGGRPPETPRTEPPKPIQSASLQEAPQRATPQKAAPQKKTVATAAPLIQKQSGPRTPARAVPSAGDSSGIFIQAGAFADMTNAKRLEKQLKEFGTVFVVPVVVNNTQLYRVRLGPVGDDGAAEGLLSKVRALGYDDAQIVRF